MNKFQKRKNKQKSLALEQIEELFKEAELRPKYANRYVALARKISRRAKTKIPSKWKRRFCKKCGVFWTTKTLKTRLNKGKKTYSCMNCNALFRVPYKP